ncbi:MAG: hypothetical protein GY757_25735, partial [bacterium]|nr:hypothetical protein [bacterium]
RIRRFDMFQSNTIDVMEQELIYKMAEKLNLCIPHTDFVGIHVHDSYNGMSLFKQSFDHVFLEQNRFPNSIIFTIDELRSKWGKIKFFYNPFSKAADPGVFEHLDHFLAQLHAGDENLLLKYFDIDYMARFETLRSLLKAPAGFYLEDNVRIIYNTFNGKFYPILDESNLYNNQHNRENKFLRGLINQIENNPLIEARKKYYTFKLAENYDELKTLFKKLGKQYADGENNTLHSKLRLRLITDYFKYNVFKTLKKHKFVKIPEGIDSECLLMGMPGEKTCVFTYRTTTDDSRYLDYIAASPELLKKKYKALNLLFTRNNHIIIPKGEYTITENVYIPMGFVLELRAGTVIRMGPGVSLVSYSPLRVPGTGEEPIVIKALDKDKPFGVWAVNGVGEEKSYIRYLDFSGGSNAFIDGSFYPGGLNFHNSSVEMRNSSFHHTYGHDGLNVKRGKVLLEKNKFSFNRTDHVALDYCKGVVRNNNFIDDMDDREGDAIDLSGSDFFIAHNQFAHFLDKGLSIGEGSRCFLYDNTIRQNGIGLASKNRASVLAMNNRFINNDRAIAAYQKEAMFGGGHIYLLGNDFRANDLLYKIDKDSKVYKLAADETYSADFRLSIQSKKYDALFPVFDSIISHYQYKENQIETFYVGGHRVEVDEKNKVIFAALPPGAATSQKINCLTKLESAEVYIKPIFRGIGKVGREESRELKLANNQFYDFEKYIFYGKIILKHKYQRNEYELYVTTGSLPIIDIDTSGEHGVPHVILNEPRIPCKLRIFTSNKVLHMPNKKYSNKRLDAEIEGRGKRLEKWKYGINLCDAYPLEGMASSRKWVLESSFIEKSLMRTKLAFDLLEQLRADKKSLKIAPQSRFVEVFLNGDYFGVYLLMEHVNKDFLGLEEYDKNKDFNALLYRARNKSANFSTRNYKSFYKKDYKHFPGGKQPLEKAKDPLWGWHSGFEQRFPRDKKYGEHWKPIEDFTRFVALSSDKVFSEGIFRLMDMDAFINLWIFTQFIDDSDGIYKNRYIVRQKGRDAKWFIIPWDKDGVMGRKHNMKKRSHKKWLSTNLFERCMMVESFRVAYKKRWQEVMGKGIISRSGLYDMIDKNMEQLKDAQVRNFLRWPSNYYLYPDSNDFFQEVDYLKTWIKKRIKWLNKRLFKEDR